MLLRLLAVTCFIIFPTLYTQAQSAIQGVIKSKEGPVPFAHVTILETKQGSVCNTSGIFKIKNLSKGDFTLEIGAVGYRTITKNISLANQQVLELDLMLENDWKKLDEVVVTGTRTLRKKTDSPVVVDVLDAATLVNTQSMTLSEGLCFQPGLRVEVDCQTCNYTQLRMNGLGGSYSQLLIDSRPVFSSLNSLYGMEQIPANMIERVEVVRGGGSAVYGSSAIGGTVNIITKEPLENNFSVSLNQAFIGAQSPDTQLNLNTSFVNDEGMRGVSVFGVYRNREAYDDNGDGFSEIPILKEGALGAKAFWKNKHQGKLTAELHAIIEKRRGGDQLDEAPHESLQAEDRLHKIIGGGLNYEQILNSRSDFSVYVSSQYTDRDHYTGIDGVDAYGITFNSTIVTGAQYNYSLKDFLGSQENVLTVGAEYFYDDIYDEIPLYNYLIDQTVQQLGFYAQSDWTISQHFTTLLGFRLDHHNLVESLIFNPRVSLLYKPDNKWQFRGAFSTGYRAPQAFDADMHVAFAGGGVSLIRLDEDLKEERSRSLSASINFDQPMDHMIYGFTIEGFYTRLLNPFILEDFGEDEDGNIIFEKRNGLASDVRGITLEGRVNVEEKVQLEVGYTLQKSTYEEAVEWSVDVEASKEYLRTPNNYGYYTLTYTPNEKWVAALSGVHTGSMIVPHIGGAPGVDGDSNFISPDFFEHHFKLTYKLSSSKNSHQWEFFAGVQNIFDAYQDDFDTGQYRDSNYIYGPAKPRTVFGGLKFSLR